MRSKSSDEAAAGELLAAALLYASLGWYVVPLHDITAGVCSCRAGEGCATPGKHPRLGKWPERATVDKGTIAGWWEHWPTANVGVLTGARSGLLVIDVDPRHGGDEALFRLEQEHGPLPLTVEAFTGGGGRHLYFQHPGGELRSFELAPGLEVKADGSFVVAPPSRTGEPR